MIPGNDRKDMKLSMILHDFDDKNLVKRIAKSSDAETLDYYIKKATAYGRQDVADFLTEHGKKKGTTQKNNDL